jgi:hypothetical protein
MIALASGLLGLAAFTASAQDPKTPLPPNVVPSTFRAFLVTDDRFPPVKTPDGKDMPDPRNRTGKIHCLVCENGLAPVVAIFVRADAAKLKDPNKFGASKSVGKLVKSLDALIPKYRSDKLAGFVMFLRLEGGERTVKLAGADGMPDTTLTVDQEYPDDEKRDEYAKDIKDFAGLVNAPNVPFGLAPDKSKAVTAWKIPEKADVVVIVYNRMRIVGQPWVFEQAADLTDEKIAEILKSAETAITGRK